MLIYTYWEDYGLLIPEIDGSHVWKNAWCGKEEYSSVRSTTFRGAFHSKKRKISIVFSTSA